MSTRGMAGVAANGQIKASFNKWDSYLSALGVEVLAQAREIAKDIDGAREQFHRLQAINLDVNPTADQERALLVDFPPLPTDDRDWDPDSKLTAAERYAKASDTESRWSVLLDFPRRFNVKRMLDGGLYYEDGTTFCRDNIFCEWAYMVDLDREELQVYCSGSRADDLGLGPGETVDGKPCALDAVEVGPWGWGDKPPAGNQMAMIGRFPLNDLPTDEDLLISLGSEWEIEEMQKRRDAKNQGAV